VVYKNFEIDNRSLCPVVSPQPERYTEENHEESLACIAGNIAEILIWCFLNSSPQPRPHQHAISIEKKTRPHNVLVKFVKGRFEFRGNGWRHTCICVLRHG
jgi:hypothetical protein